MRWRRLDEGERAPDGFWWRSRRHCVDLMLVGDDAACVVTLRTPVSVETRCLRPFYGESRVWTTEWTVRLRWPVQLRFMDGLADRSPMATDPKYRAPVGRYLVIP